MPGKVSILDKLGEVVETKPYRGRYYYNKIVAAWKLRYGPGFAKCTIKDELDPAPVKEYKDPKKRRRAGKSSILNTPGDYKPLNKPLSQHRSPHKGGDYMI